jgi:hypothetical protein
VPIKRKPPNRLRTDEDTIDLVRRLAVHYLDAVIAHILNRQDRRTDLAWWRSDWTPTGGERQSAGVGQPAVQRGGRQAQLVGGVGHGEQ